MVTKFYSVALLLLAFVSIVVSDSSCSGTVILHELSGKVTDHEGGGKYVSPHMCSWVIRDPTESGHKITIRFTRFDLANRTETNNHHDFVDIRDGPNANSPEIAWYTGSDLPPVISSSGGSIFVQFYAFSDDEGGGLGFEFEYSISTCQNNCVGERNGYCFNSRCNCEPGFFGDDCSKTRCEHDCGNPRGKCEQDKCICDDGFYGGDCMSPYCEASVVLDNEKGEFTDHHSELSGKDTYLHNARCTWLLSPNVEDLDHVRLTFTSFETEAEFDYVVVYDGINNFSPVLANLSGSHNTPFTFKSSGPDMFITYTTDVGLSFAGFTAKWESVIREHKSSASPGMVILIVIISLLVGAIAGAGVLLLIQRYHQKSQEHYTRLPMDDGF
jgi:hypothetical protein